ncbi:hypothetical protein L3Y34_002268 [Caenorhabditis briggsae]|uniref:Uncharacterized protein n=1 Tax=Caenorhabditis briggsae TaxID=6238 RepID=A0AAE9DEA2_CAEBR|nr:hypothetical protein L3Y34_002268 [Caenorhabditis briggsae]
MNFFVWLAIEIFLTICCFSIIVSAVVVGIKLSQRKKDVIVVNTSPAASPASAPDVNHKAASKKSKKKSKTGGTSAMNSEPSKPEEEDPGLGA